MKIQLNIAGWSHIVSAILIAILTVQWWWQNYFNGFTGIVYDNGNVSVLPIMNIGAMAIIFVSTFWLTLQLRYRQHALFLMYSFFIALVFIFILGFSFNRIEMYVLIGSYLRDAQGVNIFTMDWGGWAENVAPFDALVGTSIIYSILRLIKRVGH